MDSESTRKLSCVISVSCDSLWVQYLEEIMPSAEITHPNYDRRSHRYASDSSADEWAWVAPLIPPVSKGGRSRRTDMCAVWRAIQYLAATGCHRAFAIVTQTYGATRLSTQGFPALHDGSVLFLRVARQRPSGHSEQGIGNLWSKHPACCLAGTRPQLPGV